ncbi:protein C12orf4 homolog [Ornithodoros turicata]|uniref:protein C12orf4 homolog n=1 Tax=Ornithodoros turicata TaxID=34597 RepID=UPI00313977F1
MPPAVEAEFLWEQTFNAKKFDVKYKVSIPSDVSVKEIVYQIMNDHNLPCYVEDDLTESLSKFIERETGSYYDQSATDAIEKFQRDGDVESLAQRWGKAFREEHLRYATREEETVESKFSAMYHTLIHSPALDTILSLEHAYALAVGELVRGRDDTLAKLQARQTAEMERCVQQVGMGLTDQDINGIAARHFDENQTVMAQLDSKIDDLKCTQKREFREWIRTVYEDYTSSKGGRGFGERMRAATKSFIGHDGEDWAPPPFRLSESFTIHLGSQLKVMHNLRLLSADVLDLCRHTTNKMGLPAPQRLHIAMSLYSNSLCGLVLMVDNRINSYVGIKRQFAAICHQSTELHFPDVDQQLENIRNKAREAAEIRAASLLGSESSSSQSSRRSSFSGHDHTNSSSPTLQAGDFYVTHHSNLSEAHVVFHMVEDDTLRSSDITSRHPVILGLRNMLRVAHERDVCNVTIPLLLVHELYEEMTIPWCLKRAELVFKCIKGFMIELASLVGEETRTVQFMVPQGISEDLFANLSAMLSSIFRISNPLVLK